MRVTIVSASNVEPKVSDVQLEACVEGVGK